MDQARTIYPSYRRNIFDVAMRTTNLLEEVEVIAFDLPATPPMNCYTDMVEHVEAAFYGVKVKIAGE